MPIKKILIFTTVLAVSALLSSCRNWEEKIVLREGDPAPLFSLNDINGKIWRRIKRKGSACKFLGYLVSVLQGGEDVTAKTVEYYQRQS